MDFEGEQLHCPVCGKAFLCKNGLESHVEASHPNYSIRCHVCNVTFHNQRTLRAHNAVIHGKADSRLASAASAPNGSLHPAVPVGFHELTFADFSAAKFPLIAKQWCEDNVRRSSSTFHHFECAACKKAFPCAESLELHVTTTHLRAKPPTTPIVCDQCAVVLADAAALRHHKQTIHAARALNFDDAAETDDVKTGGKAEAKRPANNQATECVAEHAREETESKERFLSMLQLYEKSDHSHSDRDYSDADSDGKSGVDYYQKLHKASQKQRKDGQRAKPAVTPPPSRLKIAEENNNSSDFADIQKIIQTANNSSAALPPLSATPTSAPNFQDVFRASAPSTAPYDSDEEREAMYDDDDLSDDTDGGEMMLTGGSGLVTGGTGTPSKFACRFCEKGFDTFNSMKGRILSTIHFFCPSHGYPPSYFPRTFSHSPFLLSFSIHSSPLCLLSFESCPDAFAASSHTALAASRALRSSAGFPSHIN